MVRTDRQTTLPKLFDGPTGTQHVVLQDVVRGHGLEEGIRLGGDLLGNVYLHNVKVVAQLKDNKQFSIHHLMRSLDILIEILDTMFQLLA